MAETEDLLIEIGTEELPPTALRRLSEAFRDNFKGQLAQNRLSHQAIQPYASPRRLALLISGLDHAQSDQNLVRKGPALAAAYDDQGNPTPAALGFARSCGVDVTELVRDEGPKGAWLTHRVVKPGRATTELVPAMTEQALAELPIPKRMRWGDGDEQFVRPVHWVVLLFGSTPIPGAVLGVEAGTRSVGHRFLHPEPIRIRHARDYAEQLRARGYVEVDFLARSQSIRTQVEHLAEEVGGTARIDQNLLQEVTALCEWPIAIMGSFDEQFLDVPPEVLIETMQKNQKYFPVLGADGRLQPRFITISNIESKDPSVVRAGNERVIRPRFADAAFFWQQDLKRPLEAFVPGLESVVFEKRLGTLAEKSARVSQIGRHIAGHLGLDEERVARAAHLAKCDLLSSMIFEFPSLQGIMGRYYAERSGEDPCVVAAMEEQYLPRHAGDRLPQTPCGRVLSLADRLDTLVGIFAIGQRPTGVKDPYALRRASLGVLRLLIETPLELDLKELLEFTAEELRAKVDAKRAADQVFAYVMDRLQGYYQDQQIDPDTVDAVLARSLTVPSDIDKRIRAVQEFRSLPQAKSLAAANKRIRNVLRKAEDDYPATPDSHALELEPEKVLNDRILQLRQEVGPLLLRGEYAATLKRLSTLREAVDYFFDNVMVMVDDAQLRCNRLSLLHSLHALFLEVADISRLQPR